MVLTTPVFLKGWKHGQLTSVGSSAGASLDIWPKELVIVLDEHPTGIFMDGSKPRRVRIAGFATWLAVAVLVDRRVPCSAPADHFEAIEIREPSKHIHGGLRKSNIRAGPNRTSQGEVAPATLTETTPLSHFLLHLGSATIRPPHFSSPKPLRRFSLLLILEEDTRQPHFRPYFSPFHHQ
ncbi:uncharacterized protein CLUP02_16816 [Colletotrichum lupini]|uniref:Uncharacterized protein n=1 Tax=Colletotrichum lupini TaxID=145971 RepID=A0A9Q8WQC4_9PEZI|nr:uncharacterized protein CLUP02_16816 [Colletotrichum lupini]UQC91282.1 hypothetical protein CLUP02_16816 [Colletotrichum lupini]